MGVPLFECQKIAGQTLPQRSVVLIKQRLCQPVEAYFFLIGVIELLHAAMRIWLTNVGMHMACLLPCRQASAANVCRCGCQGGLSDALKEHHQYQGDFDSTQSTCGAKVPYLSAEQCQYVGRLLVGLRQHGSTRFFQNHRACQVCSRFGVIGVDQGTS
jgi:hypothetical protein